MTHDFVIKRWQLSTLSTLGKLFIGDDFFCYTLEDTIRGAGIKIPGETAIPAGEYKVKKIWSPKYNKFMPLIYNTPNGDIESDGVKYSGVRFHGGNDHFDSEGCILLASNFRESSSKIISNEKEKTISDFVIWGSKSNEFNQIIEDDKEYSLLIINEI